MCYLLLTSQPRTQLGDGIDVALVRGLLGCGAGRVGQCGILELRERAQCTALGGDALLPIYPVHGCALPRQVPFRLTQNLTHAMGVLGADGVFRQVRVQFK